MVRMRLCGLYEGVCSVCLLVSAMWSSLSCFACRFLLWDRTSLSIGCACLCCPCVGTKFCARSHACVFMCLVRLVFFVLGFILYHGGYGILLVSFYDAMRSGGRSG